MGIYRNNKTMNSDARLVIANVEKNCCDGLDGALNWATQHPEAMAEFAQWLEEQQDPSPADVVAHMPREIVDGVCSGCEGTANLYLGQIKMFCNVTTATNLLV